MLAHTIGIKLPATPLPTHNKGGRIILPNLSHLLSIPLRSNPIIHRLIVGWLGIDGFGLLLVLAFVLGFGHEFGAAAFWGLDLLGGVGLGGTGFGGLFYVVVLGDEVLVGGRLVLAWLVVCVLVLGRIVI